MERVTFLVEPGQERLGCLLNPESLVTRRRAGIEPRRSIGGPVTGAGMRDDRLLFTGGGRTEFELDLLFDVTLAGSSIWRDRSSSGLASITRRCAKKSVKLERSGRYDNLVDRAPSTGEPPQRSTALPDRRVAPYR